MGTAEGITTVTYTKMKMTVTVVKDLKKEAAEKHKKAYEEKTGTGDGADKDTKMADFQAAVKAKIETKVAAKKLADPAFKNLVGNVTLTITVAKPAAPVAKEQASSTSAPSSSTSAAIMSSSVVALV